MRRETWHVFTFDSREYEVRAASRPEASVMFGSWLASGCIEVEWLRRPLRPINPVTA